jgi:hypothetical protein
MPLEKDFGEIRLQARALRKARAAKILLVQPEVVP